MLALVIASAYARRGYFVDFDPRGNVVVYRGQNGGFLWFDPTMVSGSDLNRSDLDARTIAQGRGATALRLAVLGRGLHRPAAGDHDDHDRDHDHDHDHDGRPHDSAGDISAVMSQPDTVPVVGGT